jgi:peptide/nickel transport system substrate-binding protein
VVELGGKWLLASQSATVIIRAETAKESTMTKDQSKMDVARRRLSRRGFVGGSAAAAAAAAVGIPSLASAAPSMRGVSVRRGQNGEPQIIIGTLGEAQTINPFVTAAESETDFRCKMLYDEFVRANVETYAPEPGLAESWEINELTFSFKIRDNATFSDGTEVTAQDVAFTFHAYLDPEVASPRAQKFMAIAGAQEYVDGTADEIAGIRVIDDKNIEISLATPDAPFLYNMRFIFVVPAAQLEGQDIATADFFNAPVGAGPYVFQSWDIGADFVATANPYYWQEGKPAIQTMIHRTIADANSLVLALESGDIDASNYPAPTLKDQLEANENLVVMVPPFLSGNGWLFNTTNEWLAIKEVRQAIAMALNTEQFTADALLGLSGPALGPIAPGSWAFDPDLEPIPYDPEAARQLLADAGVPEGTQIRFNVNQGNVLREDWLTFTQQALQEIGIEVVPELMEYATLVEQVVIVGDYDATGVDFAGVTAEPSELYDQFHSTSPGNASKINSPELDALLEAAKAELDIDAAREIYAQIQRVIMDEVPMFFAWYRPFLHVVRQGYEGYTDSAAYGLFHTLEDWTYNPPA